jgi:peptide/nickel transport system permease protein
VRRRLSILIVTFAIVALVAPLASPYNPETQYREFLFAPPMPPRVMDGSELRAPFVYPIMLTDRLSQRYEENRARIQALPWFTANSDGPVFLLGSDSFGRDLLSRILHGARVSIGLALVSALGALALGALIGALAGYRGGVVDDIAMRAADLVVILPIIYVVLVLRAVMPLVLPPTTVFLLMAGIFTLVGWPFVARAVRGVIAG